MPLNERHLFGILKEWVAHYYEGRPRMSLGPGIPQPMRDLPVRRQAHRHRLSHGQKLSYQAILCGLHHDYGLENRAV